MVKAKQFEIKFGHPHRTYRAGGTVTGSLIVDTEEPQDQARIELKFVGKADVHFSRDTGGKRREHFFQTERYFHRIVNIWPEDADYEGVSLLPGCHEFPFIFSLPTDIPSSYHCQAGNIRYSVKATITVKGRHSLSTKEFFIVFQSLNLNDHISLRNPVEYEEDTTLCCLCCASGHLEAKVSIPKKGYVPGEKIPLVATIHNNSGSRIIKTYFTIEEVSCCYAMGKTEKERRLLKNVTPVEHPGIAPGSSDTWTGEETCTVPVVVPPLLECWIIDLQYILTLYVVPSGPSCNMTVSVPIVIGTHPFTSNHRRAEDNAMSRPHQVNIFSSREGATPDRQEYGHHTHHDREMQHFGESYQNRSTARGRQRQHQEGGRTEYPLGFDSHVVTEV